MVIKGKSEREGESEIFFAPTSPLSFLLRIIHPLGKTFFLWKIQDGRRTFYRIQGKKVRLKYSATHLMELNSTLQKCNIWTDLSLRKFALEFSLHSARDLSQFLNSENFK